MLSSTLSTTLPADRIIESANHCSRKLAPSSHVIVYRHPCRVTKVYDKEFNQRDYPDHTRCFPGQRTNSYSFIVSV